MDEGTEKNIVFTLYDILDKANKLAKCKLCGNNYSYKTTSGNLKAHIQKKHSDVLKDKEFNRKFREHNVHSYKPTLSGSKVRKRPIWNYFTNIGEKRAQCNLCSATYSFLTTTSNLRKHLSVKHVEAYELYADEVRFNNEPDVQFDDTICEELLKYEIVTVDGVAEEVWRYFEQDLDGVRCVVCRANVEDDVKHLKGHLRNKHPRLAESVAQDSDDGSDRDEEVTNEMDTSAPMEDEIYSEVVYLEEPEEPEQKFNTREPKKRRKTVDVTTKVTKKYTETPKKVVKKPRRSSNSSDDVPVYLIKKDKNKIDAEESSKNDNEDDIDLFGKYVVSLLKKVPNEICTKLQMDIVTLIMNAKLNYESEKRKEREVLSNYSINISNDNSAPNNTFQLQPSGTNVNGVHYEYVLTSSVPNVESPSVSNNVVQLSNVPTGNNTVVSTVPTVNNSVAPSVPTVNNSVPPSIPTVKNSLASGVPTVNTSMLSTVPTLTTTSARTKAKQVSESSVVLPDKIIDLDENVVIAEAIEYKEEESVRDNEVKNRDLIFNVQQKSSSGYKINISKIHSKADHGGG